MSTAAADKELKAGDEPRCCSARLMKNRPVSREEPSSVERLSSLLFNRKARFNDIIMHHFFSVVSSLVAE